MGKGQSNTIIKFLKSSGIFLIGTVLSKSIVFFMLPLYTAYILPADYGYYDLSITYITLLASFLFFDVWTSVMRFMYDSKTKKDKLKAIYSGWSIFGVSSLLYFFIAVIVTCFTQVKYVPWIFAYGLSINLSNMYGFAIRGFGLNKEYALSGILSTVVTVGVNLVLIVGLRWNYSGLYIATVSGIAVQILYLEAHAHLLKNFKWEFIDKVNIREMFFYSLPLCVNTVAYWLLNSFNRIVINGLMGTEENGIFAVGAKFGTIISFITTCFAYAWQDLSFSYTAEKGNDGSFYSSACNTYMKFLGAGAAILIPGCYLVFPIMVDNSYAAAKNTIPLFLLVGLISALSTFIGNVFYAIKETKSIFISLMISCVFNMAACYPFIQLWGLNGANLSIFLSFLLNIVIRNAILHKKVSFRLDVKIIVGLAIWISLSMVFYEIGGILLNGIWFVIGIGMACFMFHDVIGSLLSGVRKRVKT